MNQHDIAQVRIPAGISIQPSTAHGDSELNRTAEGYERALRRVVAIADGAGGIEPFLEIPPVI